MDRHCNHNIPETKKGIGPCNIQWEVKKRNGKPNWWCRTHGLEASTPDGAAMERCPGSWFDAVADDMRLDVDLSSGEFAVWGVVPAAIVVGVVPREDGSVHVHYREAAGAKKTVDRSYEIVNVQMGTVVEVVEAMAARAFSISELMGVEVHALACPHPQCGETHIDELMFATRYHVKHLCNSCGRNFRHKHPTISNPLAGVHARLGLPEPRPPKRVDRVLDITSSDFAGIAMWPSNRAILSTMSRPEDEGVHVHAWSDTGELVVDETHSPVILDGQVVDERRLRMLAVQRSLAENDKVPIVSMACKTCGHSILSPTEDWIRPATKHVCDGCGAENRTRRKSFLNPLAGIGDQ